MFIFNCVSFNNSYFSLFTQKNYPQKQTKYSIQNYQTFIGGTTFEQLFTYHLSYNCVINSSF